MMDLIMSNGDYQLAAIFAGLVIIYLLATFIGFFVEPPRLTKGDIKHQLLREVLHHDKDHKNILR